MSAPPGDVVDRLERLASRAPRASADPDVLWRRGRWGQRRRAAYALAGVAAAGVLASVLTPAVLERTDRPVAAVSSEMVLPDVLQAPGAWEPAFSVTPLRLSAVGVGQRSSLWSSSATLWGVSAATGEARWLELPDSVPSAGASAQVSADGRRLAYWVTGKTSGAPLATGGTEDGIPVVGVAVMDLETGEVTRWDIASEHGLWVQGLRWAGDVLWWEGGAVMPLGDGVTTARDRMWTWNVRTGERMEAGVRPDLSQAGDAPGGFVTLPRTVRLEQVTGAQLPDVVRVELPTGAPSSAGLTDPEMAPDGEHVAALMLPDAQQHDDSADKDLLVGTKADGAVTLQPVGEVQAQAVLGWRSPTEVVVSSRTATNDQGTAAAQQAWVVDVTTGARTELLGLVGPGPESVAADAWAAEVVAAPDPPFAPDPRLVGAGAVVVLAFAISLWRDVRRRRGHP